MLVLYHRNMIRAIGSVWSRIFGLFELRWGFVWPIFFFFVLLHYCEVTYKNNYFVHTNLFLICNRLYINYPVEVSIISILNYYF